MDTSALFKIQYGLYVLTAAEGEKQNGCIVNTVMQVTDSPLSIVVCVNKNGLTHDMIKRTGKFNVSALSEKTSFDTIKRFGFVSGKTADKFPDGAKAVNGVPVFTDGVTAYICCDVIEAVDFGTHTLFRGIVKEAEKVDDGNTLTYNFYQQNIKPKPKPVKKAGWICVVCGYIYEGEILPPDFICPLCKHGAADFKKIEPEDTAEKVCDIPAEPAKSGKLSRWKCKICGYIYEGEELPADYICPKCKKGVDFFVKLDEPKTISRWKCKICGYIYEGEELPADYICPKCKKCVDFFVKLDEPKASKWKCRICGYIYEGEELPADYVCPLCKNGADKFEKVE